MLTMPIRWLSKARRLAGALALLLLLAPAPARARQDEVRLSDAPRPVQAVVRRELRGARNLEIRWRVRNGKPAYEVDAEIDRRDVELIVAEDGKLLRKRMEIRLGDLPAAVRPVVRKETDEDDVREVTRYEEGGETWYQVEAEERGYRITLWLTSSGRLLRKQKERRGRD